MTEITDKKIDDFYGEYERVSHHKERREQSFAESVIRRVSMEKKKDCFAYRRSRCNILTEMVCCYGTCSFYKTEEQDRKDRRKYIYDREYKKTHANLEI